MTVKEVLAQLESLGNEKVRLHNKKYGAGDNQYGVKMGDIRTLAKKIKTDHKLALALWDTGNVDARMLTILVLDPKALSLQDLDRLVRSINYFHIADWLNAYVIKLHPDIEQMREKMDE